MNNPWIHVSKEKPYLIPEDREIIERFNKHEAKTETLIHTELLPEPYLGNPKASLVLLNLNPGFHEKDSDYYNIEEVRKIYLANLLHTPMEYPFYLLNPILSEAPGHQWWKKKLKFLIDHFDLQFVSQNVFCVEYFSYHSRHFGFGSYSLKSQEYSFDLVKRAIVGNVIIVLMRSKRLWFQAIPELEGRCIELKNPQNPIISPGNFSPGTFEEIVEVLRDNKSK